MTPFQRSFTHDDQLQFAETSGDWNPVHVDPVEARRTPYGQIVHGIHALAWALDGYMHAGGSPPSRIRVSFQRPIGLNQCVTVTHSIEGSDELLTLSGRPGVYSTVRLTPGGERRFEACTAPSDEGNRTPATPTFAEARGADGVLIAWGDDSRLTRMFPDLVAQIGSLRVAALLTLSRLVGMILPGLHSVFTGLDVSMVTADVASVAYRVSRHSIPNAPVRLSVEGAGLAGSVDAFFRPVPAEQASVAVIGSLVGAGDFAGQSALIIGGSRGLGEATAKLVAIGGGDVTVTYHVGEQDAQRVAGEIIEAGGRCRVLQLDVREPEAPLASLIAAGVVPTHVYYFASPPIHANRAGFDSTAFDVFASYYVLSFERLCRVLARGAGARVFYPSTVFLEHLAIGFAEYVCAKAAGEALCGQLVRVCPNLSIVVERLPRTHTDQTNSLLEMPGASAHDVMLGIVRRMSGGVA